MNKIFYLLIFVLLSINEAFSIPNTWCVQNNKNSVMNVSQSKNPIPPLKPNSLFNKCPSDYMSEISLNKVKQFYSSNKGKKLLCNLIISKDGSKSFSNKTIKPYHELATIINTDCNDLIEKRKENYRKEV